VRAAPGSIARVPGTGVGAEGGRRRRRRELVLTSPGTWEEGWTRWGGGQVNQA